MYIVRNTYVARKEYRYITYISIGLYRKQGL